VEDEPTAHGSHKEADDAGNRVDPHGTDSPDDILGIGQAQISHEHGRENGARDSEKGGKFKLGAFHERGHAKHCRVAPGSHISGMASGIKSISRFCLFPLTVFGDPPAEEPENRSNPMRNKMIPPTMRTMLRETLNIFSMNVPKTRKKNKSSIA
jgi:hypothetical protein